MIAALVFAANSYKNKNGFQGFLQPLPQATGISLVKSPSYSDHTVVVPKTAYRIGAFQLTGDPYETVYLDSFVLDVASSGGFVSQITDVYFDYNGITTSTLPTVAATGNTWSIGSDKLSENETIDINVYASIGSNFTGNLQTKLTVYGTGAVSGQAFVSISPFGQIITQGVGTIVAAVDPMTPAAALVTGSSNVDVARFKFTATNDDYTLDDLKFIVWGPGNTVVSTLTLKDGAAVIGTQAMSSSSTVNGSVATFTALNIVVPANTVKILTVELALGLIGPNVGSTGSNVAVTLDQFKAKNSVGFQTVVDTDYIGNSQFAYKVVPTIVSVPLPTAVLNLGTQTISKFTIIPSVAQPLSWKQITFSVTKTSKPLISGLTLFNDTFGVSVPGVAIPSPALATSVAIKADVTFIPDSEQIISAANTYSLKALISGAVVIGDSVSTSIENPNSKYSAPNVVTDLAFSTVAGPSIVSPAKINYSDKDGNNLVSINDVRKEQNVNVSSSYPNSIFPGVVKFDQVATDAKDEFSVFAPVSGSGSITNGSTIKLTETGNNTNIIGPISGTLVSVDGYSCSAQTLSDGMGLTIKSIGNIQSILCTHPVGAKLILNTDPRQPASNLQSTTITLTLGAPFAIGSVVAAGDSDVGALLVTARAVASFAWSDNSALTHDSFPDSQISAPNSVNSSDWNSDFKVPGLPTVSQILFK